MRSGCTRDVGGAFVGALAMLWLLALARTPGRESAPAGAALLVADGDARLELDFMLWATAFPASSSWLGYARDPLLIAFFGVNLPEAVVGNGLLGSTD